MKVTGERFIPGQMYRDAEVEHFHRYTAVQDLVKGKIVLDAACGSGYGSKLLSDTAEAVFGLDLSDEAIEYAERHYQSDKIKYIQGSVESLPFDDGTFDVVISFETIEHVDGYVQRKFLKEIFRVLKSDGIMVMSSPNKKLFTDDRQLITKFHVKEFYEDEFRLFLSEIFPFFKIYNQYFSKVSNIIGTTHKELTPLNYDYQRKGLFFIAVASKKELPEEKIIESSYYYPEAYCRYNDKLQVFFSNNGIFTEEDCFICEISNHPGIINETIELENVVSRYFRIDPNGISCRLQIQNITFILTDGTYLEVKELKTNADMQNGNIYTFYSRDPQIICDLGKEYCVRGITLQIQVISSDMDLYPEYVRLINENISLKQKTGDAEKLVNQLEILKAEKNNQLNIFEQEKIEIQKKIDELETILEEKEKFSKKMAIEKEALQSENEKLNQSLAKLTDCFEQVKAKWWYKLFYKN